MAVPFTAALANLTCSAASGDLLYMFGTSLRVISSQITIEGSALQTTGFSGSAQKMQSMIGGLRSATIDFNAIYPKSSPLMGIGGLITHTATAPARTKSLTINIEYGEIDITGMAGTADTYRSFMPGGIGKWGGSFTCRADSATAAGLPTSGAATAGTFKLIENGSSDATLAGDIIISRLGLGLDIQNTQQAVELAYTFEGSGDLTQSNLGITAASSSTVGPPDWDLNTNGTADNTIIATLTTGRTITAAAFWRSLVIETAPGDIVKVSGSLRLTDALTLA